MAFTRAFRNLQGKFSTAIATFNFQPRFNFSTAIRCFSFHNRVVIFNAQLRLKLSIAIRIFNAQLRLKLSTAIRIFNAQLRFQLSTAIRFFNAQLRFQLSTAIRFFNAQLRFQLSTAFDAVAVTAVLMAFTRAFRNLQGKFSTAIATFNFQPRFNFSTFQLPQPSRYFQRSTAIPTFNRDSVFQRSNSSSSNIAVMVNKRADLVPPMVGHMHAVLKLQQSMGGMTWLQYDWKSRKEMSAMGTQTWEKRDPW